MLFVILIHSVHTLVKLNNYQYNIDYACEDNTVQYYYYLVSFTNCTKINDIAIKLKILLIRNLTIK